MWLCFGCPRLNRDLWTFTIPSPLFLLLCLGTYKLTILTRCRCVKKTLYYSCTFPHIAFNLYRKLFRKAHDSTFLCPSCFISIRCLWRWQHLFFLCISQATRDAPISWLIIITWARRWPIAEWCVICCYAHQPKQCTGIRGIKHLHNIRLNQLTMYFLPCIIFFGLKIVVSNFVKMWYYQNISLFNISIATSQTQQHWVSQWYEIEYHLFCTSSSAEMTHYTFTFGLKSWLFRIFTTIKSFQSSVVWHCSQQLRASANQWPWQ